MFTRLTGLVSMLGFAILAACHATSSVRADGLILKLPADGTQVEFKVKAEGTPAPLHRVIHRDQTAEARALRSSYKLEWLSRILMICC